jgi:hypothetical protein
MEIRSIIDVPKSTLETAGLKPGDLLQVRVVGLDENGRALVEVGRWRVSAEIRFPVTEGDEFLVRVMETENRLSLQLARSPSGEPSSAAGAAGPVRSDPVLLHDLQLRLQQLIANAGRRGQLPPFGAEPRLALEALGRCLAPIDPGDEPGRLGRHLARCCEEGGLFLEARLARAVTRASDAAAASEPTGPILAADLKARLLFLKAFSETADGAALLARDREFAALMRAAGAVLTEIRSAQEQLARQSGAAEPFYTIHVALPMADGRSAGTLKIAYRGRRPAGKPEGHRASLLLSLDRLGAVRADLLMLQRSLNVAVFVSDSATRERVERHVSEVQRALALFFETVGVQVSVSGARIARFATEEYRPVGEGQVDVRV